MAEETPSRTSGKNRNAQRSIRMLKEALLKLLGEKPYDKITVTDITRTADLNRGTFYAHFTSVDDLLRSVMADITDRVSHLIRPQIGSQFFREPRPVIEMIGSFLEENRNLLQPLVASHTLEPFFDSVIERIRYEVHTYLLNDLPNHSPFALIASDYMVGGMVGTYENWVLGEYGDMDVSSLNDALVELVRSTGIALGVVDSATVMSQAS